MFANIFDKVQLRSTGVQVSVAGSGLSVVKAAGNKYFHEAVNPVFIFSTDLLDYKRSKDCEKNLLQIFETIVHRNS